MNFIRVSKNVGSSDHKNDPILNKFHTYQIIFNGLEYLIGVDNKTSSFFRTDNYFFIGESFSPELSKQLDLEKLIKANPEKNTHISKDYFSAILMDMKQKQVFLFSSQGHQRAVYYAMEAENFYCASQLHLLKNLGCSFETNNEVLGELFNFHTLAAPRTLIKGIRRMNPTEQLKFNLFDNKSRQCWQIDFQPIISNEKDINEIGGMTERIISSEISNMIAKDPSTSILLNGDLGSSLLAAIVNEQNKNITTFSTSFDFPFKDEQAPPFAARVANHLKVQHQVCTCTDLEYLCNMVDAIAYTGETLHSPQTVLLWNLFRQCSMHGRSTLICGWGANSLFGNDLHYKLNKYSGIVNLLKKENIQAVVRGFGKLFGLFNKRFKFFDHSFLADFRTPDHIIWTFNKFENIKVINETLGFDLSDIFKCRMDAMERFTHYSLLDKVSLVEMEGGCATTIPLWAQMAAINNVSLTFPFSSTNLIRYIRGLNWDVKCKEKMYIINHILRQHRFPEDLVSQAIPDSDFPFQSWILPNTLLQPLVEMTSEMFDSKLLKSLQKGDKSKAMLLWIMINYYFWDKLFIRNTNPGDIQEEIKDRYYGKKTKSGLQSEDLVKT